MPTVTSARVRAARPAYRSRPSTSSRMFQLSETISTATPTAAARARCSRRIAGRPTRLARHSSATIPDRYVYRV